MIENLTDAALVQQAEGAASERREAHAEHCSDVAIDGRGDDALLQAQNSLVHKPGVHRQQVVKPKRRRQQKKSVSTYVGLTCDTLGLLHIFSILLVTIREKHEEFHKLRTVSWIPLTSTLAIALRACVVQKYNLARREHVKIQDITPRDLTSDSREIASQRRSVASCPSFKSVARHAYSHPFLRSSTRTALSQHSLPAHHAVLDDIIRKRIPLPVGALVGLDKLHGFRVDLPAPLAPLGTLRVEVEALTGLASEETLVHLFKPQRSEGQARGASSAFRPR